MSSLNDFANAAEAFVTWCLSDPRSESEEALAALEHLVRLYSLALKLRHPETMDYDLEGESPSRRLRESVLKRARALPFRYYGSIFDPQVMPPESPVVGDLADDIAGIFRDLESGLVLFRAGHSNEAEWEFLEGFRTHWGRHASGAIRALHCWGADTGAW